LDWPSKTLQKSVKMFRGALALATLLEVQSQSTPPIHFDLRKLEEFSIDYTVKEIQEEQIHFNREAPPSVTITTAALPETCPSEHGSMATNIRNLQFKVDSHASFPTPFAIGRIPLSGMQIHEELHLNGATGQASFHLASPIVNMCFQLDGLPPVAQMEHGLIEMRLQQAEAISAQRAPRMFMTGTVDGNEDVGPSPHLFFTNSSHPDFFQWPPSYRDARIMSMFNPPVPSDLWRKLALKFDNYVDSVGSQFVVRACEISDHTRSQSLLAASPDAQEFIADRISQHQRRLQAVLHPGLNSTLGSMQLEISDLMALAQPCTNDNLAQMPGTEISPLQAVAFTVCSFVMGVTATFAIVRRTRVTSADDYHQVA